MYPCAGLAVSEKSRLEFTLMYPCAGLAVSATSTSTHIPNFKFKVVTKQNDGIFVKQPKYRCTGWEPCAKYPTEKALFHCYHSVSRDKTTTRKEEGTRTGMHLLRLLTAHCWRVNGSNPTWTVWQRAVTSGHIWNKGDKTMDLKHRRQNNGSEGH